MMRLEPQAGATALRARKVRVSSVDLFYAMGSSERK